MISAESAAGVAAAASGSALSTISYPPPNCSVVSCLACASALASETTSKSIILCHFDLIFLATSGGGRSSWLFVVAQITQTNHGAVQVRARQANKYSIPLSQASKGRLKIPMLHNIRQRKTL
jgi:hypothetical protein